MADRKFSIGIKPKIVDLQAFSYSEGILAVDGLNDVLDEENKADLGTFSTIDLGLAMDLSDSFRLGLNIRNLLTDEFDLGVNILNFLLFVNMKIYIFLITPLFSRPANL